MRNYFIKKAFKHQFTEAGFNVELPVGVAAGGGTELLRPLLHRPRIPVRRHGQIGPDVQVPGEGRRWCRIGENPRNGERRRGADVAQPAGQ